MSPPWSWTRGESRLEGAPALTTLALLVAMGCASPEPPLAADLDEAAPAEAPSDPAYRAAVAALAERRAWRAESLLAPALADSLRRTPWTVLLAADAAASLGRWERVDSLLGGFPLADPAVGVTARLLLARVALERGDARAALDQARGVRELSTTAETRGQALVLLARAHERLGARDSARAAYADAAPLLAPVSDWLSLRAAALTSSGRTREQYYAQLRLGAARRRAAHAEAQLLERTGRARAAIALYERAGSSLHAMRLRAAVAGGRAERDAARRELVSFVRQHSGTEQARAAIEMLDDGRYALAADEEVAVVRSAMEHGPLSRARVGLERVARSRGLTGEERLLQATLLAESGPSGRRQAARLLARIKRPSPYAGRAAFARAALLRRAGRASAARRAFQEVVRVYPRDTAAASGALLALGDMAADDRRDAAARAAYLRLARDYPTVAEAPRARFDAAILAFAERRHRAAAEELDSVTILYPASAEGAAARYWSGRARATLGDSAGARARWAALHAAEPMSYYAALAARRIGATPWAPAASPDTFAVVADLDEALARADLLTQLGMHFEARLEMDALVASADSSAERALAIANAFRTRGQLRRAMELGRRAVALGAADARAWRFIYPLGDADLVAGNAAGQRVDPALVAAVIRQESSFEPRATSAVGARGLMQVMPRVAKALAKAERIAPWDPALLYDPDVNVRLGVLHLRSFTEHYRQPSFALAAYNAGGSRVTRWSRRRGGTDPELFVERIRFAETRSYVRTVLRSREMYAVLYDWARMTELALAE